MEGVVGFLPESEVYVPARGCGHCQVAPNDATRYWKGTGDRELAPPRVQIQVVAVCMGLRRLLKQRYLIALYFFVGADGLSGLRWRISQRAIYHGPGPNRGEAPFAKLF